MLRTSYRHAEAVIVRRGVSVSDPYSGETTGLSWDIPTDRKVSGVVLAFGTSTETPTDGRNAVVTGLSAVFPRGTDITRLDRVVARGLVYEVDGDIADPVHPITGSRPGLVANLKRIGG